MSLIPSPKPRSDLLIPAGLALLGALLLLPRLGSFPLWDPWETQYSQVAWEMAQHDTWLELYYQNAATWWSKPIFIFWMLRVSFGLFWDSANHFFSPELWARLPFALTALIGIQLHFDWVRRLFGRSVALLSAIILLTAPQYLFIGRQVMTDMPFLVATSSSLGYLAVGLLAPEERHAIPYASGSSASSARRWLRRRWPFVAFWLLQGLAVLIKGFVAPVIASLLLGYFLVATFQGSVPPRGNRRKVGVAGDLSPIEQATAGPTPAADIPLGAYGAADSSADSSAEATKVSERVRGKAPPNLRPEATLVVLGLYSLLGLWISRRPWPVEERWAIMALATTLALAALGLGIWRRTRPSQHILQLLGKVGALWGLPLFLLVTSPWFIYMTVSHGWDYWNSFLLYHHLGRATGEISKPGGSFDFLIRHWVFGLFPWSALLPVAFAYTLGHANPTGRRLERSHAFIVATIVLGFTFFSLSATKLAHYVFPVLPACSIIIAATLLHWNRQLRTAPNGLHRKRFPDRTQQLAIGLTLVALALLTSDVVRNPQVLLNCFNYYYNRPMPEGFRPQWAIALVLLPAFVSLGARTLRSQPQRWQLGAWLSSGLGLACLLSWWMMPAMGALFTYEPLVQSYRQYARGGEALGQFNDWPLPARSVVFFSQNRAVHLRDPELTHAFFERPGRKFVIVDASRLPELKRIARRRNAQLHVISSDHPYALLVSNLPRAEDVAKLRSLVHARLPEAVKGKPALFANGIEFLGWKATPEIARRGEDIRIQFYFSASKPIASNYQLFVHGDGLGRATPRIVADHAPLDGLLPTTEWKPGDIIEDTFTIRVPRDYPDSFFILWTGFFVGDDRLKLLQAAHPIRDNRARGPLIRLRRSAH